MSIIVTRHIPRQGQSSPDRNADFLYRSTRPGVFKVWDFNDDSSFYHERAVRWGNLSGAIGPDRYDTYIVSASPSSGNVNLPFRDTSTFCSGTSSLCFEIPTLSGADGAGNWSGSFSPDGSALFGSAAAPGHTPLGTEFYVQWRQRFDYNILHTPYYSTSLTGPKDPLGPRPRPTAIKHLIITTADLPPGWLAKYPNGYTNYGWCTKQEIVLDRNYTAWNPLAYTECGWYTGFYEGWPTVGTATNIQNAWPNEHYELYPGTPGSQYCIYTPTSFDIMFSLAPMPGGWAYGQDEWMTFQMGIGGLDDRYDTTTDPNFPNALNHTIHRFRNSWVKVWAQRQGESQSHLIIDWNSNVTGFYIPLGAGAYIIDDTTKGNDWMYYGKIALGPYMTGKDNTQDHPPGRTWYDEMILSTQRIPDPIAS